MFFVKHFLCKVQNIYTFDIQKLTIIIYTIVRGFSMEKNNKLLNDDHVIFIDRLIDHHIEENNLPKKNKKDKKSKKSNKIKKDK